MGEVKPGVVVAGAVLGLVGIVGVQYYTISNLRAVENKLSMMQADQAKAKEALASELEKVQSDKAAADAERQRALAAMREQMEEARKIAASQPTSFAGQEALKSVKELNSRIATTEQQLRDGQSKIVTEVTGLKQSTSQNTTTIAAVTTEVREVRDQVATTRGQLESTIAELKRVNGDMGVLSGLIATNGKEIEALRQLGDRNYAEFALYKGKEAVRVGEVWVSLKSLNEGKNRYTVELRVDDRKIEKKDKAINEPVQFYVGQNRQPHELVVNQIQKNGIVGYLATPKVAATRQAASQ
jgi:hypothetical protein